MPASIQNDIGQRKRDHLGICLNEEVQFRDRPTLLEQVRLVHDALPELGLADIDLSVEIAGKRLRAPLYISGMTGGTPEAAAINRDLAAVAEALGLGFGFGSQRPLLNSNASIATYQVRDVAPTALIFGNLGLVQARETSSAAIARLVEETGADALCIHLNPAQELMQANGDRDFTGGVATLQRLRHDLSVPVVVKETGAGISARTARKLRDAGIEWVDVAGAGGTSWVGVETRRAADDRQTLGQQLWDWGIPTAASLLYAVHTGGLHVLASGGIRTGNDVAAALALGAQACGMAYPCLKAWHTGGREAVRQMLETIIEQLRMIFLLTGSRNLTAFHTAPKVLTGELLAWKEQLQF